MGAWTLAIVAAIVVAYATLSRRLDRTPITAAIFFVTFGFVFGTKGLGWIDVGATAEPVKLLAEATLTLVLFADASRIDFTALRREHAVPTRLLLIGLPLTVAAGWALAVGLFGTFTLAEALLLAIILAPTDAALGQAVVTDPQLPSRVRQGLNVESGLNDGICVPLLFIALALSEAEASSLTTHGAVVLVAEAIGYGVLFGVVAGGLGWGALRLAQRYDLVEPSWLQVLPVGTAALSYGLAAPLGGSGFIAAFVAGFTFGALRRSGSGEVGYLIEELGGMANAVTFIVFGAAIIGPVLAGMSWQAGVYALLSLTVVRMVPVAAALLGTHARLRTMAFVGWFGPRGLASIVFGVIVLDEGKLAHISTINAAVVSTIVLSVFAHGLSAQPLTTRYVRWYRAHPAHRRPPMESVPMQHQRWRRPAAVPVAQEAS